MPHLLERTHDLTTDTAATHTGPQPREDAQDRRHAAREHQKYQDVHHTPSLASEALASPIRSKPGGPTRGVMIGSIPLAPALRGGVTHGQGMQKGPPR